MKPILHVGPFPVHVWGTFVALGFLAATLVMRHEFRRRGVPEGLAWSITNYGLIGGIAGARLLYFAHRWPELAPGTALDTLVAGGGFVWYGGLLGGGLLVSVAIRRWGVPWARAADTGALGLALGYAVGRIGCHLAGDGDWGTPTALPWGMAYPRGTAPWPHPPGVVVHPAPLYESLTGLIVFAVLWRLRDRLRPEGSLLALYLVLAGAGRLLVEFVRTSPTVLFGLTEAQWTSLALIALGGAWLLGRTSLLPTPAPLRAGS